MCYNRCHLSRVKNIRVVEKMKILLIHYAYWVTGGPERYMFNIKKSLEENGNKVIPFSMSCKENSPTLYSKYFYQRCK